MTSFTGIRQKAIALINQLSTERLIAVMQLLEFLAEPSGQMIPDREATLLQIIQHGSPSEEQKRLEALRDRS